MVHIARGENTGDRLLVPRHELYLIETLRRSELSKAGISSLRANEFFSEFLLLKSSFTISLYTMG